MLFKVKKQKISSAIQYGVQGNGNIRCAFIIGAFVYGAYIMLIGG